MRSLLFAAALTLAAPAFAQPAPPSAVQAIPRDPAAILAAAPAGTRFGLLVVDDRGREVLAIRPDDRFIPASNTKLFTTAAAMALLTPADGGPAAVPGAVIGLALGKRGTADLVIAGFGTLSLSTEAGCQRGCLASLIDQIASKARVVGDVVVDDSAFTDQRWSPGMSWNNIGSDSGTATSALAIDHNELPIVVTPGPAGQTPQVTLSEYYTVKNEARTVVSGETRLGIDRPVGGRVLRLYGTIKAGAAPWRDLVGLDDPADYAGWLVTRELGKRGVRVRGKVRTLHRSLGTPPVSPPYQLSSGAVAVEGARLIDEVTLINKRSQNLHSELLIRRLASATNADPAPPSSAAPMPIDTLEQGLAAARAVFERAGIPRGGYDFADGSGMSTYNRISPRAAVALLRWSVTQPWGKEFRSTLPIGGVDGTLRRRFVGTPLEGRIWAKTGTLNATNTLSGWLQAASGRELTFSILANDVPDGANAVPTMDAALLAIAAAN